MKKQAKSELRIIGGKFRSRKIVFEAEMGLRPTHNRIRETAFNWLQNSIEHADCLDAFAGSGAMGFEALSRGAAHVTFCDISNNVIQQLKKNAAMLDIRNADFYQCDFILENPIKNKQFDLVFLDPPFQKKILLAACALLESRQLLKPNAHIYLECEKNSANISALPKQWIIEKHQSTKTIDYFLYRNQQSA